MPVTIVKEILVRTVQCSIADQIVETQTAMRNQLNGGFESAQVVLQQKWTEIRLGLLRPRALVGWCDFYGPRVAGIPDTKIRNTAD